MQFHPNEMFLLYNPHSSDGKKTKAMALDICSHINEVDSLHEKVGPTYWKEVISMLGVDPQELLDQSHPDYKLKVGDQTYTMTGWLDIIMHNPQLIKNPIAIFNGKAIVCHQPSDILKLGTPRSASKVLPHLRRNE
ncbi:MAG: glutaredoxin [Cyclobacteriaceae bacterium]|nr:glutaredoxin [Cyclobacteriaceae bacterium]UYN85418.1 MAG: glutaredoxin [Cyclobacteriaceae bacterium]